MKLEFNAYLKEGKLIIRNRKLLDMELPVYFKEGQELEITIERKFSKRSEQQNKWWWVCMGLLSKHFGYTKDEMHQICKFMFLKTNKVDEKTGEAFEYLRSSTELTKSEFSEMTEKMIQWSAEHGVIIPLPNEQISIDL